MQVANLGDVFQPLESEQDNVAQDKLNLLQNQMNQVMAILQIKNQCGDYLINHHMASIITSFVASIYNPMVWVLDFVIRA